MSDDKPNNKSTVDWESICNWQGCHAAPEYAIVLELRHRAGDKHPAISDAIVFVCEEHLSKATFVSLTPHEWWQELCNSFRARRLPPPSRTHSNVKAIPINEYNAAKGKIQ